ncbi:MAG: hypothetical protein HN572_03420 [Kordiimonadaceae bacterium]|jgi:phosphate-selective porin OprO and OprP|nr:hypothetical protein [Kordiimonadaceae bacterium]MBT7581986.1 hypothetical protein [Kordiimonadaceae bacterium]
MFLYFIRAIFPALIICAIPISAYSQQESGAGQTELDALQKQIDALKAKVDKVDAADGSVVVTSDTLIQKDNDFNLTWEPGPVLGSSDGLFSFEVNGRMTYDFSVVNFKDGDGNDRPEEKINGTDLKHLEFGIRGKAFGSFNYRVVTKFVNDEIDVKMAYVDYSIGNTTVVVGKTRIFNTLDKRTSPPNFAFAERATFVNAFKFDRAVGIGVSHHGKDWSVSGGYFFKDDFSGTSPGDDSNVASTRLTYSPRFENGLGLHFGTSALYSNRNGNDFDHNYSARPFLKQGDYKPLASESFNISSETFIGGEFVATYKSFAVQSEYGVMKNKLSQNEILTSTSPKYNGGYVEVSFFPTGAERLIDGKDGRFDNVKIASPVGAGGLGELLLAARYDKADLSHEIFGRKQTSYILAANWFLNDLMNIQGNYAHSVIKNSSSVKTDIVDTFNLRFMINF